MTRHFVKVAVRMRWKVVCLMQGRLGVDREETTPDHFLSDLTSLAVPVARAVGNLAGFGERLVLSVKC